MDKSPSERRTESSKKRLGAEVKSRATKLTTIDAQLTKFDAILKRLNEEFDECESHIVVILKSREVLINRMYWLIATLEDAMICFEYAEKARKKLEEKRAAVTSQLVDPNLDAEREQQLHETIEDLADIQEDLGKTQHGAELSYVKCVQFESQLNALKAGNESVHQRLCEELVQINQSRHKVLAKCCQLLATRRTIEGEN